ncbi:MAG: hypothetical protein HC851_11900 [Acaryochloris sp. RU_4_1]|nr:hypothetical protein [Acaryochloris sp. RU_4_1]NJR54540.1 hypothetical protein [Acaryochloris sp. CRU_2_0]
MKTKLQSVIEEASVFNAQADSCTVIRDRYMELAQAAHQDLDYPYLGTTYDEYYAIIALYPDMGQTLDRGVLAEALLHGESPERACALMAQSPYVQSQLHSHQQTVQALFAYGMPLITSYCQAYRAAQQGIAAL